MVIFCEWTHVAGFFRRLCRCLSYICLSDLLPAGKMCDGSPCKCDWISSVLGTIPSTSDISYVSGKSLLFQFQAESLSTILQCSLSGLLLFFLLFISLLNGIEVNIHWSREWLILVILVVFKSWQLCQLPHLICMKNHFLSVWRIFCFWYKHLIHLL